MNDHSAPDNWHSFSAEDKFTRVVEAAPTALILVENDGRIRLVNSKAERMFGYSQAELQGKELELLMPERFRDRHVPRRQGMQLLVYQRHKLVERVSVAGLPLPQQPGDLLWRAHVQEF